MPTFLFSYRQSTDYAVTPESTAAWMDWFGGMGGQVVDMGKPVAERASVGNCSPESTQLGGYSLITADDLDAALVIAKGCPHLDRDGGVEIGQLGVIPGTGAEE